MSSLSQRDSRFAAKLLFQFRKVYQGKENSIRTCEERIVWFVAKNAADALVAARNRGIEEEDCYAVEGRTVHFEFVGIIELIELGLEAAPDEVWWEFRERLKPMERKRYFIPPEDQLAVFRKTRRPARLRSKS